MTKTFDKSLFAIFFGISLAMIDLLLFPTKDLAQGFLVGAICTVFGLVVAEKIFGN